jgi:hypothetical protein
MANEILFKYALDSAEKIIHINNAQKGTLYYCPDCHAPFSFKKGKVRQPHFSHTNSSTNCTGEGYLHKTFKKLLLQFLKDKIINNSPIEVLFNCYLCKQPHRFNPLVGIIDIKDEFNMEVCRPDIALIHKKNVIPIVIEIIDKHEIDEQAIAFYIKNQIIVIRIKLETETDLENIEKKLLIPTDVLPFNKLICPNFVRMVQQPRVIRPVLVPTVPRRPRRPRF